MRPLAPSPSLIATVWAMPIGTPTVDVTNLAEGVMGMTSNAWLVDGTEPVLVDAGAGFDIIDRLEDTTIVPERVVLTHTHPDHVGNLDALRDAYDLESYGYDPASPFVDQAIDEDELLRIGDTDYEAWFTPGHAPDHLCFYSVDAGVLFSGDLIFPRGGVGRTDLPGSNHEQLRDSILRVLRGIDRNLEGLYTGHGPAITTEAFRHVQAAARHVGLR